MICPFFRLYSINDQFFLEDTDIIDVGEYDYPDIAEKHMKVLRRTKATIDDNGAGRYIINPYLVKGLDIMHTKIAAITDPYGDR